MVFLRPARFDNVSGRYYPPRREICFNPSIINNDGLLTNSIARKDRISFEAASDLLSRLVDELRQSLALGHEIPISGVGTLSGNDGGQIMFTPADNHEFLSTSLPVLRIAEVEEKENENRIVAVERDERYYHLRLDKRAVRVAAMFAVVVLAALSFLLPGGMNLNVERASVFPTKVVSRQNTQGKMVSSVLSVPDTVRSEKKDKTVKIESAVEEKGGEKAYHLIVASLKNDKEVEIFMSQHKDSDYKLNVIPGKTRIWISAEESNNFNELRSLLNSPEFASEYPGAWILKNQAQKN